MEVCKHTLKHKFIDKDKHNPGKQSVGSEAYQQAMVSMASMCLQVCSGVKYLHEKGYVHRDLKLENILVGIMCSLKVIHIYIDFTFAI